jgi:tRNA dimethylallyltransferase
VAGQKWGQADNLRYDCCFISVDASLPVLDRYVEQRVDDMMDAGLLNEVYNIYTMNADYTRGLRQAIGVREFENLLRTSVFKNINQKEVELIDRSNLENTEPLFHGNLMEWLRSSSDTKSTTLLEEAIEKVKVNTRRLVRRQVKVTIKIMSFALWLSETSITAEHFFWSDM